MDSLEWRVLASGQVNGVEWRLIYETNTPYGQSVMLIAGATGAGSGVPVPFDRPFGGVCRGGLGTKSSPRIIHGSVQAHFVDITIQTESGEPIKATIVDTETTFGFNYFVAPDPNKPFTIL